MNMPRGKGAEERRRDRRSDGTVGVEGASRALDPAGFGLTAAAPLLATSDELDALMETLAPIMTCANCGHMADLHTSDGCMAEGCSCGAFEEAAADTDALQYRGDAGADLAVVAFEPSDERLEAAIAELTFRSPDAEPLVRVALEGLRLERFAPSVVAPPLVPPVEGGGALSLDWDAVLAPEGRMTDDGRAFAPGSIRWRELPLSLAAMLKTAEGHDGAVVCGRIDEIWRDEAAGLIRARGVFDDSEWGREVARLVADRTLRGNSVDIAPLAVEVGPRSRWFDADGNWAPQEPPAEEPSIEAVLFDDVYDEPTVALVTDAVIGMSTVCPFPAFADAHIEIGRSLVAAANPLVWTVTSDAGYRVTARPAGAGGASGASGPSGATGTTVTAAGVAVELEAGSGSGPQPVFDGAGAQIGTWTPDGDPAAPPVAPPADWFANPELEALTPLTVTDEGRLFGHAAGWGSCHTGFPDVCVTPPYSQTDYRFYLLKEVVTADGSRVAVGTITLGAPHAGQTLTREAAMAHYDNTGTAAADVVVGEDAHGIWVAGAVRSTMTAEAIRELRGAALSGDWRNYQSNLEMVALLAVNVPGFPIPRVQTRVASGVPLALVAAGIVAADADGAATASEWLPPAVDDDTAALLADLADTTFEELSALAAE